MTNRLRSIDAVRAVINSSLAIVMTKRGRLVLVTVATDRQNKNLKKLVWSARQNGFDEVAVLGENQKPLGTWKNVHKLVMFDTYLQHGVPETASAPSDIDLVVFVDGYDVFVNGDAERLRSAGQKNRITFGTTCTCFPPILADGQRCLSLYAPESQSYLNAAPPLGARQCTASFSTNTVAR